MNCEQGDLAIIVKGKNSGVVVRCLSMAFDDKWSVKVLSLKLGCGFSHCSDAGLRPLRDTAGIDETLIWAGFPKGRIRK